MGEVDPNPKIFSQVPSSVWTRAPYPPGPSGPRPLALPGSAPESASLEQEPRPRKGAALGRAGEPQAGKKGLKAPERARGGALHFNSP